MERWDQDIHRVQEIQQLLEDRQKFFSDQLNTPSYKLDKKGDPLSFHTLQGKTGNSTTETSIGHSLEATFGTSESNNTESPVDPYKDDTDESGGEDHVDDFEARCADHSQTGSSSAENSSEENDPQNSFIDSRNATFMRRWVHKNKRQMVRPKDNKQKQSERSSKNIQNQLEIDRKNLNKAAARRLSNKSVTFDDEVGTDKSRINFRSTRRNKRKESDPFAFIKERSWRLRAEIVNRLNGDGDKMDLNLLNCVTRRTVKYARERLKLAEQSLEVTSEKECFNKVAMRKIDTQLFQQKQQTTTGKVDTMRKPVSRMTLRNAEEAMKNELNLREVFAMIKINPDPILKTSAAEANDEPDGGSKSKADLTFERYLQTPVKGKNRGDSAKAPGFEDPEITEYLNRLTKLSLKHKQKQKSLISEHANPIYGHGSGLGLNGPLRSTQGRSQTASNPVSGRRKSSTVGVAVATSTAATSKNSLPRRRSKDAGPKLGFSSLEASLRAERKGSKSNVLPYTATDKLSGTIL